MAEVEHHTIARGFVDLFQQIRKLHGISKSYTPLKVSTGHLDRFKYRLKFSAKKQVKVIITGLPRSGTGYLKSLINQFADSTVLDEIFDTGKGFNYNDISSIAQELSITHDSQVFGFKYLFFNSPTFIADFQKLNDQNWHFFYAKRENVHEQALSFYLSNAYNTFHRLGNSNQTKNKPIEVSVEVMEKLIQQFKMAHSEANALLNDFEFLNIIEFDSLFSKSTETLIEQKLNLKIKSGGNREKKTFENNWELVKNKDEISDLFLSFSENTTSPV